MTKPQTDPQTAADRLAALVEAVNPEAEPLPDDPGVRITALEEGFAVLLKEAGKVMHALRHEHRMREDNPGGLDGKGWNHAFGTLAGYEAGMLWVQAKGLCKLGRDEDLQRHLRGEHKRLVNNWDGILDKLGEAYKRRNDLEGLDERTEDWIKHCLRVMKQSYTLFKSLAKNRARRIGPKQAALARHNAEMVRRRLRQAQQQLMQAATEGVESAKKAAETPDEEADGGSEQA